MLLQMWALLWCSNKNVLWCFFCCFFFNLQNLNIFIYHWFKWIHSFLTLNVVNCLLALGAYRFLILSRFWVLDWVYFVWVFLCYYDLSFTSQSGIYSCYCCKVFLWSQFNFLFLRFPLCRCPVSLAFSRSVGVYVLASCFPFLFNVASLVFPCYPCLSCVFMYVLHSPFCISPSFSSSLSFPPWLVSLPSLCFLPLSPQLILF